MVKEMRLMQKSVHAERLVRLVPIGREQDGTGQGTEQAGEAAEGESKRKIAHVTKEAASDGEDHAADTVGKEYPGVILPHVFVAEFIGGQRWEEGEIAAEVEADESGAEVQQIFIACQRGERHQHQALTCSHQDHRAFSAQGVAQDAPDDAADAIGEAEEDGHGGAGDGTGFALAVALRL